MWVPPESRDPVVMHAPTRKSVACFGAVNLSTGRLVTWFCPVFNGETFDTFVRRLLRHRRAGRRMVVVLDNAAYHHARVLKPLLHKHRRHLDAVTACFLRWQEPNETLRRLCCIT